MRTAGVISLAIVAAALFAAGQARLDAQPAVDPALRIGATDLGGVVTGANGPEAGVWVIAETTELPTKFAKIVVTDDRGRYVLPELPKASYSVWVRGYGLVDSPKVRTAPGKILNLTAVPARNAAAAAEYYPAIYWYSMLRVPDRSEFPGTGPDGNGINPALASQEQWLDIVKTNGCNGCHSLGTRAMRAIPRELGTFASSTEAWQRRIQSGQALTQMTTNLGRMGAPRALKLFADWTDRIAAGELPTSKPMRPQGVERNVVLTLWDWAGAKDYLHDEVSTDKRNPRLHANGPIFGATEESTDLFPVLDPVKHKVTQVRMLVRDPATPSSKQNPMLPSPFWGDERIWDSQTSMHNPMLDEKGRVWFTSRVGPAANPDFCKRGSEHPSAKLTPVESSNRHLSVYEPKTGKITLIRTCFPTHHLVFAEDANNTLWTSAGGPQSGVIGWLNRKMFDATGDEVRSQGWTALILDTNGNGKRDEDYVEPNQPVDPAKDKRIVAAFYGIGVNPNDGTIWGTVLGFPGYVIRLDPGSNPPATSLAEVFEPPLPGYGPRGRADRDGQAVSGRLDPLSFPRPAARERERDGQRRGELLHVGGPVRHVRARPRRADGHRQPQRIAPRARERHVRQPARAVSAGLLHEVDGRAHRRSGRGLEGQGPVGDGQHPRAVPHGRRQGDDEQGREVPAAPGSAREVTDEVYDFMALFPQPARPRPAVEYVPLPYRGTRHGRE